MSGEGNRAIRVLASVKLDSQGPSREMQYVTAFADSIWLSGTLRNLQGLKNKPDGAFEYVLTDNIEGS